jgi:hypothetical protein
MSRANFIAAVCAVCAAASAALLGAVDAATADEPVPTYTARYGVDYKGRNVGESVHTLERENDHYRFRSVTEAQGIARLLRRNPIVEQSLFELYDGAPRPLEFRLDDGTRKGEDDVTIDFDWPSGTAHVATEDGSMDLPLEPGVHDRATLQLALMLELAERGVPASHALIDDASVKTYSYEVSGQETLDTPAGTHDTVKVMQRREGSSRHTIIWLAPDLHYLPVKIEQRRDDETLTTLLLESVQGLSASGEGN